MSHIKIVTTQDLIFQKIRGKDLKLAEIENPRSSMDERLQKSLPKSYVISFGDVNVLPRLSDQYPNPTLMHFALARYIAKENVSAEKVLDLGCGTGFLGNFAAKYTGAKEIVFADLNPDAVNQSLASYALNNKEIDLRNSSVQQHNFGARINTGKQVLDGRIGDASRTLQGYDAEGQLALAAPYFIPGFCGNFPKAFHLFGLLAKNTGAKLMIGHSNLSNMLVEDAANSLGLSLDTKYEQEVPFIPEYTDNRENPAVSRDVKFRDGVHYHSLMISVLQR